MNLQDFACSMSDLIWGGELGWDRKGGLEALADAIRKKVNTTADAPQEKGIEHGKCKQCGGPSFLGADRCIDCETQTEIGTAEATKPEGDE